MGHETEIANANVTHGCTNLLTILHKDLHIILKTFKTLLHDFIIRKNEHTKTIHRCLKKSEFQLQKTTVCVCVQHSAPSGLVWFLKLHSLQKTLKREVVGVAVDRRLVGTRAHYFWLQRREGVGSTSLHVHLQLQQDLQGVCHLCLTGDGGQGASAAMTHITDEFP